MTSAIEDEYPLDRTILGSSRLYMQHWLWQRLAGNLLHSSIAIKENMKIADIACGTGIWVIDLAKELEESNTSVQLDGFDISAAQYPPSALLPSNVKLDILDIFEPAPEELRGQYDVIHISLLCLVIRDGDPRSVLDNLLTLLKPGGYIQWKENDFSEIYCTSTSADISTNELNNLKKWVYEVPLKGFPNFEWIRQLSSIFQERGITILEDQLIKPEADIAYAWTLMHMHGMKELVNVAAGGSKEAMELHRRAAREVQRGACLIMRLVNVVGRKAGGD
ncbi:d765ac0a-58c1-485a-8da0-e412675a045b [Sclerotinia trifoliorum]|uniref:D765ac0a-58c1-485a-8da0-e412675a045b n=1 Tax=Sclerotinia trifoliorum TaxID=28548 RepID=A0A8H2VXD1_9HELO|nr:d765ac0a-58c1-485a-8da0-e412675a045b [Sclerotinia trifoliorum]